MRIRKSAHFFAVILTALYLLHATGCDAGPSELAGGNGEDLYPNPAGSNTRHWEFAGWCGGGLYPNVEFDPNAKGRVYLVSDVAGIWRSTDSGEHWSFITRGLNSLNVSLIAIAPSDSGTLYVGTAAGLFVWKEANQSWAACDTYNGDIRFVRPASHRSIAVSKLNPDVICIGTATGSVLYSTNGGQSWAILGSTQKPVGSAPIVSVAYGSGGKVLYAASQQGLVAYSFETNRWTTLAGGPSQVTDFVVAKESPDKLYVAGEKTLFITENGGKTWKQSARVPKASTFRVSVFSSAAGTLVAVAVGGKVFLSRNEGQTWISANNNMYPDRSNPTRAWAFPGFTVTAVKIDPFNESNLFRTDYWGVWRSDDGGASWREKIKGAPNVVGSDIVIGATGNIYAAAMDNGLVTSPDRGQRYRPLFPAKNYGTDGTDLIGHVWRVLVFGERDDTIIGTSSPAEDVNQVILSTDGGASFTTVRDGLPSQRPRVNTIWSRGYPRALAADPQNPKNLYLGIDGDDGGGLYLSRDGGQNWTFSPGQPASKKIYNGLDIDPLNPANVYWGACGGNGGVYLSEDSGATWRRTFSDMSWVFDLKVAGNGYVYAAGSNNGPCLYASSDRGVNWTLVKEFPSPGVAEAISIDPQNPSRIALSTVLWEAASGGRIYLTEDGGNSWEDITGDLPEGSGAAAMAFSPKDGFLYITRYAGSVYRTDITGQGSKVRSARAYSAEDGVSETSHSMRHTPHPLLFSDPGTGNGRLEEK